MARGQAGAVETMLQHIVKRGAPAQAAHARALLEAQASAPESEELRRSAEALIEAYLHDPYLTRGEQ